MPDEGKARAPLADNEAWRLAEALEALREIAEDASARYRAFIAKPHDDGDLADYWAELAKERQALALAALARLDGHDRS